MIKIIKMGNNKTLNKVIILTTFIMGKSIIPIKKNKIKSRITDRII